MRKGRVLACCLLSLLGLAAVSGVVVGVRYLGGDGELEAALRHERADEAWLEALPRVDARLRARAWAWMKAEWPGRYNGSSSKDYDWFLSGGSPPEKLLERHEIERAHMQELTSLLAEPGICLSSAVWAESDRPDSAFFGWRQVPNLISSRNALRWFGVEAMLAEDPLPALEGADRLVAAMQPSAGFIDSMIFISMRASRDDIYLRLIQRGVLPRARRDAWLMEPPAAKQAILDCYRAERLLAWAPMAKSMLRGDARVKPALYGGETDLGECLDYLWYAKRDVATILRAHHLFERFLNGKAAPSIFEEIEAQQRAGGRLAHMGMVNHRAVLWQIVDSDARHRLQRLLVHTARLPGVMPATESELRERIPMAASLMDAGPLATRIRYRRVGANRIRFFVASDTPLPAPLEQDRCDHSFAGSTRPAYLDESPLPREWNAAEMQLRR